ncbi:MAG: MBOAT family O-acyltransferase [Coriobacteriales bacterium]|nr:MBOAT family O-acyltransferase [Coriobacteriales bacterium]
MVAAILANWAMVLAMERSANHRRAWMVAAIGLDVALLGVFKYASFVSRNVAALTGGDALVVDIALPLGISFFTFQLMSYVFDVYGGKAPAQSRPARLMLYISLFPQLVAGPIVRYEQIEGEISGRRESAELFARGCERFVYGLGKKLLLANYVAQVADNAFDYMGQASVLYAWLGAVAYALQIYFDFSGYSDMAIGLGQMFGFHFPENFDYPYMAATVTDFWRRWHMTLSRWFRDYVYIPLGGNRVPKPRWLLNMLAVWLLTGIWHGANWTFVLWGLAYWAALCAERLLGLERRPSALTRAWTLVVVLLAWVLFRSPDVASAMRYVAAMLGVGAAGICGQDFLSALGGTYVVLAAALVGCTPLVRDLLARLREGGHAWVEQLWLVAVLALCLLQAVGSTYNPFIYFNF